MLYNKSAKLHSKTTTSFRRSPVKIEGMLQTHNSLTYVELLYSLFYDLLYYKSTANRGKWSWGHGLQTGGEVTESNDKQAGRCRSVSCRITWREELVFGLHACGTVSKQIDFSHYTSEKWRHAGELCPGRPATTTKQTRALLYSFWFAITRDAINTKAQGQDKIKTISSKIKIKAATREM